MASIVNAIFMPATRASYSPSLLKAEKSKRMTYSNVSPLGLVRTNPAPAPLVVDDSSTWGFQLGSDASGWSVDRLSFPQEILLALAV